jgi:polar amino acid transport system substrate-binding protein
MTNYWKPSTAFRGLTIGAGRFFGRFAQYGATLLLAGFLAVPAAGQQDWSRPDAVPLFWDLQRRTEKPDTSSLRLIRFVTDDNYPPFGFQTADGGLTGFNVDLARAICEELALPCTIQARRFDTILPAIETGEADAAIASIAITPEARKRVDFTSPYYRTPARFAATRNSAPAQMRPSTLEGRTVGVVNSTAHAAYLARYFSTAKVRTYPNIAALLDALKSNEVNIVFADGISLAVWLNGTASGNCCEFRDGAFTESAYFGEGAGIAINNRNIQLRLALNYALVRLAERGVYADLYLKYFPVGFY